MQLTLDKRTRDDRWFDLDCTKLLGPTEIWQSITSITADQPGLTFGGSLINSAPIVYPDGTVAAIGKVIKVEIIGGIIPIGRPWFLYYIRAVGVTNLNPALDATVILRLIDNPQV